MSITIYTEEAYLAHHGIKGQKWGERRFQNEDGSLTPAGQQRYLKGEYKNAKKAYKQTVKDMRTDMYGEGWVAGRDYQRKNKERQEKLLSEERKVIDARVAYAKAKKGDKGEEKAYVKEMYKSGLSGSVSDQQSGGRSTALYDHIAAKKGEEYAKRIERKVKNKAITNLAIATAVTSGAAIALTLFDN